LEYNGPYLQGGTRSAATAPIAAYVMFYVMRTCVRRRWRDARGEGITEADWLAIKAGLAEAYRSLKASVGH
jgi:hypothetical protein